MTRGQITLWLVAIATLTILAYLPALDNGLTNWDDNFYVLENPHIQRLDGETVHALFFSKDKFYMGNFHPLSMLSLAFDYQIAGFEPWIYHLTNLLLHVINTILVFWLVFLLFDNVKIALVAAALFGVHTLHAESVVWVSERKDVLHTLFFLSSIIAYLKYLQKNNGQHYLVSLMLFVLALLAKGQAVSLAVTLVAIDLFRGRSLTDRTVILEKIPFFALSLTFGIVAIAAQQTYNAIGDGSTFAFWERLLFACYGFVQYLVKLVLPTKLSVIYPYPQRVDGGIPLEFWFYPIPVMAIIAAFFYALRRSKPVAFAMAFFVVNIFLVLQLIPVGNAIMADRYTYVPSIGFFLLLAVAYYQAIGNRRAGVQKWLPLVLAAYLVCLTAMTFERSQVWKSSMTLWNDVISKYPTAVSAWNNRGAVKRQAKDFTGAIEDYEQAIKLDPRHAKAFNNRGACKFNLKDYEGAIKDYNLAIALNPDYTKAYRNRSNAYFYLNKYAAAAYDLEVVLKHRPRDLNALFNHGVTSIKLNRYALAIRDFDRVTRQNPNRAQAHFYNAIAKEKIDDLAGAIRAYDAAIKADPNASEMYYRRGLVKIRAGQESAGCTDLHKAEDLGYTHARKALQEHCSQVAANPARKAVMLTSE